MEIFKNFDIGKYLTAIVVKVLPKTVVIEVKNKHHGDVLGQVRWMPTWRQYCYKIGDVWYSESCLRDLADYLHRTNDMHKAMRVSSEERKKQ
jgi:hypothetical protein